MVKSYIYVTLKVVSIHSLTHLLTHLLTHSFTVILNPNNYLKAVVPITTDQPIDVDIGDRYYHLLNRSLTPLLTRSLTYSPTHSLTHSLTVVV